MFIRGDIQFTDERPELVCSNAFVFHSTPGQPRFALCHSDAILMNLVSCVSGLGSIQLSFVAYLGACLVENVLIHACK